MKQFLNLIQNELYKSFFQKKTILFVVFMVLCVFLSAVINSIGETKDWRKETQDQITRLEEEIKKTEQKILDATLDEKMREMEISVLEFQKEELAIQTYRLEKGIPEDIITPLKFVYKCKGLFYLITLFMIVFSANIFVNEYKWGTIRQLFVKPVGRKKIFWSKYVFTIIITFVLSVFLVMVSILFGYLFYYNNSISIYEIVSTNGMVGLENMFTAVIKNTIVIVIMTCILNTISMCIAALINNSMLAVFITLGIWMGDGFIGEAFKNNIVYRNFILANVSLDNYLSGGILPYEGATLEKSLIICIIYLMIFLLVAKQFFSKKEVY